MTITEIRRQFPAGALERRFTPGRVELRAGASTFAGSRIVGYAAKFNQRSENLGTAALPIFEIIEPGFFDRVLNDDVRCLFNHDANLILGRTPNTLRVYQDSVGLHYECPVEENISYARDLAFSLGRGDVTQSSFAFSVRPDGERWVDNGNEVLRYLKKGGCAALYDVSPVTYPAYPSATSALADDEAARGDPSEIARKHAHLRRKLDLAELET